MTKQTRYSYNRHKISPFYILLSSEIILLPTNLPYIEQKNLFFFTLIAHQDIFGSYLISPQILHLIISCIVLKCNDVTLASNFGWNSTLNRKPAYDSLHSLGQKLGAWLHWNEFHLQWVSVWRLWRRFSKLLEEGQELHIVWLCHSFKWNVRFFFPLQALAKQADGNSELVFSCTTMDPCVCLHLAFIEIRPVSSSLLSCQGLLGFVWL